ncbi:universal stress protein family protein [Caballeronia choica]|jgi:nucleotide-binding universal stress UspA family protein|uniref:Universal stress protein family protein n=1 Tax=Caballeronia choica TaxID=326476 RepID=A0A158KLL3_9BURK|nr:universal stress protein [Caballeronia choica]SAL81964.1 universal stress protein family protein [Caballeronia choica]
MSYKTIVVQLDTSERTPARIDCALHLATHFRAHLSGVFSDFTLDPRFYYEPSSAKRYRKSLEKTCMDRRAKIETLFRSRLAQTNVAGSWVARETYGPISLSRYARCADLTITGQHDREDPEAYLADRYPEQLVLSAGRPLLIVPHTGAMNPVGAKVLVAWDGSREATRAVHDALPFLQVATRTAMITIVAEAEERRDPRARGSDLVATLARHGVQVEQSEIEVKDGARTGETLLSFASEFGADLIVMGAYGHSRWHELILGGATQTVLEAAQVPVLMSN